MADTNSVRSSNPPNQSKPVQQSKLTFRFAMDEIDAIDIAAAVNESYSVECEGGQYRFRVGDKITAAEVESNLLESGCKSRWIVLETPEEEEIVAAGRFVLDFESKSSTVDIACAIGENADLRDIRFCSLVNRLESIVYSHGMSSLIVEVSSCRTDVQTRLEGMGYEDRGGRVHDDEQCLQPTMILSFKKELRVTKERSLKSEHPSKAEHSSIGEEGSSTLQSSTVFEFDKNRTESSHSRGVSTVNTANTGSMVVSGDGDEVTFDFQDCDMDFSQPQPFLVSESNGAEVNQGNQGSEGNAQGEEQGSDVPLDSGGSSLEVLMSQLFKALHSENKP